MATTHSDSIYIIVDVESNGPSVKHNSMFAFGAVAIDPATKTVIGSCAYSFPEEDGTAPNLESMKFWNVPENRVIYDALHAEQVTREEALRGLADFWNAIAAKYPAKRLYFASDCLSYDWKFIDTALQDYVGNYVMGYSGFDIYSYAAATFGVSRQNVWNAVKDLVHDAVVHDHDPYNDALSEAVLLVDVMCVRENAKWTALVFSDRTRPTNKWIIY